MKQNIFFSSAILFIVTTLASLPSVMAEYYKYVDKNGNIRYTDNLSIVPKDKHSEVDRYGEYQSKPYTNNKAAKKDAPEDTASKNNDQKTSVLEEQLAKKTTLDKEKQSLDEAYQELLKEKNQLDNTKKNVKNRSEIESLKKQIAIFNAKIQSFEKRKKIFEAEVTDFNRAAEIGYILAPETK